MAENKFGKTSQLSVRTRCRQGKTELEELAFTAPYKVMTPFPKKNGGISVIPLCASAGIMEGDRQEFYFHVREGTDLEMLSQSFEKIHKMKEGCAVRCVKAEVEKNAVFYYHPQPVIPYGESAFESRMEIRLEDMTSRLFLQEIISCGRNASQERFAYRKYASLVTICRGSRLIYRDNTRYEPSRMPMEGMGLYEGYTHMANLFLSCADRQTTAEAGKQNPARMSCPQLQEEIWSLLEAEPECDGGVTRLVQGDLAVRIFGYRAQKLQEMAGKIKTLYEMA